MGAAPIHSKKQMKTENTRLKNPIQDIDIEKEK